MNKVQAGETTTVTAGAACASAVRTDEPSDTPALTFTHKLSWDEQRALSQDEFNAYCDWLFAINGRVCRRRERDQRNPNRDVDKERAIRDGEDYEVFWGRSAL